MKTIVTAGAALLMTTSLASAVGLDRSNQPIGAIFEDAENYVELTYGSINPTITGADAAAFGGSDIEDVTPGYSQLGFAYKRQINDAVSLALIFDEPYGADVTYGSESIALGGTEAILDSSAISVVGRYEFGNGFSAHAGLRYQSVEAEVTLAGLAYGALNGYNVVLDKSSETGFLAGVAYERPDIALRVALTYFGEVDHTFDTTETLPAGLGGAVIVDTTEVTTPAAWNLDFQTGIAQDTLLFGNIRFAEYETVITSPTQFNTLTGGSSLTDLDDGTSYNIGVGRRFTDQLSASVSIGYEAKGDDNLVSPLAPSDGNRSIALGAAYNVGNGLEISGGIRYLWLGDAQPETSNTARAEMTDNDVVAIGIKFAYEF